MKILLIKTKWLFSYYTTVENSRISILSEWSGGCNIIVLARINGLPNKYTYDYKTGLIIEKEFLIKINLWYSLSE